MTLKIFNLREKPEYVETCAAWEHTEWGCHEQNYPLSQSIKKFQERSKHQKKPNFHTWIGLVGNKLAGMISLKQSSHPDRKDLTPWVGSFFIHPAFRKKNYGAQLLEKAEEEAYKLKHHTLYLYTNTATELYHKYGWEKLCEENDPAGITPHVWVMKKRKAA